MSRIEFKAYGGTGALIGRSFITLLALNACDMATNDHKNDVCVLYQMDYDESTPREGKPTEASYLKQCVEYYQRLHKRNLEFLAPIRLEQDGDATHTLKAIRKEAYNGLEGNFSMNTLFCSGPGGDEIYELLSSAFTANANTLVEELERSNADGCYGDLAVNGFISERLISSKAFARSGIYSALCGQLDNAIVFYAGSTDGGTANTMIDKDIRSLLHYLAETCNERIDHGRRFRLYGLRTTPYSYFNNRNGSDLDRAVTNSILRDKFQMSLGVLKNISDQNARATNDSIEKYSYYKQDTNINYWLDGLFLSGSETLDLTDDAAHKDGQFHPSHLVELALAEQAMDAIAHRLPPLADNAQRIYGYNEGGSDGKTVTLEDFFGKVRVSYQFKVYDVMGDDVSQVELYKYIRAFLLTLVTVKGRFIPDFRSYPTSARQKQDYKYIYDLFLERGEEVNEVVGKTAREFEKFLEEVKFIVMTLVNVLDCSKFKHTDPFLNLVESEIRYIYDKDNFGQTLDINGDSALSIADNGSSYDIKIMQEPTFNLVDGMHTFKYHQGGIFGGGANMKHERKFEEELRGANNDESAYNVANDYIRRTFETYLATMI